MNTLNFPKAKQGGFTLLELLVVVAILAAIAGTATIALRDTDARASAAAHVAMMDELNKGVRTFRVLRRNQLPNNFDSLLETDAAIGADADANATAVSGGTTAIVSTSAIDDIGFITISDADVKANLADAGMSQFQYVSTDGDLAGDTANPDGAGSCSDAVDLIANVNNAVVAGNLFLSPGANGCGMPVSIDNGNAGEDIEVAIWTGGYERVIGEDGVPFDATPFVGAGGAITGGGVDGAPTLMAVGAGPSSNLFNANELGGLTTVPIYRHVGVLDYNRMILLFDIGAWDAANQTAVPGTQNIHLVAVVDGAGDTKEEELGEWDGTRNTI
ncbi:MAG: type II secretion system protein [Pseudomonadota bacterium]